MQLGDGNAGFASHGIEQIHPSVGVNENARVSKRVLSSFHCASHGRFEWKVHTFIGGFGPQHFFRCRRLPILPVARQLNPAAQDAFGVVADIGIVNPKSIPSAMHGDMTRAGLVVFLIAQFAAGEWIRPFRKIFQAIPRTVEKSTLAHGVPRAVPTENPPVKKSPESRPQL